MIVTVEMKRDDGTVLTKVSFNADSPIMKWTIEPGDAPIVERGRKIWGFKLDLIETRDEHR